ncbi:MAG: ATPase [Parachlamydia sp.]|nr:ATPase [Parachlamydia sp.]
MFFGREHELEQLETFFKRPTAGLAVCSGRRRIGKSTLIEHAAKGYPFYEFYGLSPREGITTQDQLDHFSRLLSKHFSIPFVHFSNWQEALDLLASLTRQGHHVIFLDEISWMGGKDKDFPGKLKGVWDTQFKKNPELKLILCGSVSSWIQENILQSKGFVGRVSLTIDLEELPLYQANQFWSKNLYVSAYEKCKILCVIGGVPRYLEEIDPKLDAEKNIKQLAFTSGGLLVNEFDKIFSDLFGKQATDYQEIVRALIHQSRSTEEIAQFLNIDISGHLSHKLTVLKDCGFVARDYVWHAKRRLDKLSKYRLRDNYLRFYLKYIEPKKDLVEKKLYTEIDLENLPDWSSIIGLQFENLVLNNLRQLIKILDISPESLLSASPYFQNATKTNPGCQVDLMLQTKYTTYLCEVKCCHVIETEVIHEIIEKIERLKIPKTVSLRPVLIYQGELSKSVIKENFFSKLISFEDLLAIP